MDKKKKKILLIGSVVLIAGAIGYLILSRRKEKPTETLGDSTGDSTGGSTGGTTPSGTPTSTQADRPKDVKAFQSFANSKGYTPRLVEDGIWGAKTAAAWKIWGSEYKKIFAAPTLKKGDVLSPKPPLLDAIAYSTQTGKAIGRIRSAVYDRPSTSGNWFFATANIPTGALNIPAKTPVQLQVKDWTK